MRYIVTILRSALADPVKHGRLAVNSTDRSTPPSPSQTRPPEMHAWTAPELGRFLRWAQRHNAEAAIGWWLLAYTGMRRGEALALRWRDVDLDAGRIAVRRSLGVVKAKGQGEQLVEGATKTGQSRVVDPDAGTVAALRGAARLEGLVLADLQEHRQEQVPAATVFIMIGAEPRTDWLAPALRLDEHGFVLTGRDVPATDWPLTREPHPFETSQSGSSRPVTCGTARTSGSPGRSARGQWPSGPSTATWPSWPPRLSRRGGRPWRTQRLCDPRLPRPAAGAARPSSPSRSWRTSR